MTLPCSISSSGRASASASTKERSLRRGEPARSRQVTIQSVTVRQTNPLSHGSSSGFALVASQVVQELFSNRLMSSSGTSSIHRRFQPRQETTSRSIENGVYCGCEQLNQTRSTLECCLRCLVQVQTECREGFRAHGTGQRLRRKASGNLLHCLWLCSTTNTRNRDTDVDSRGEHQS